MSAAIIPDPNIAKAWTADGTTRDCQVLLLDPQRKSPPRDVVGILQRENKTLQTGIRLLPSRFDRRFPLQRSEVAENVLFRVQNHMQRICVAVTSAVRFLSLETIATASPRKRKPPLLKVCEDLWTGGEKPDRNIVMTDSMDLSRFGRGFCMFLDGVFSPKIGDYVFEIELFPEQRRQRAVPSDRVASNLAKKTVCKPRKTSGKGHHSALHRACRGQKSFDFRAVRS
jgi:hypothetical protein